MSSGVLDNKIFSRVDADYNNLSLNSGSSQNLNKTDFSVNNVPYSRPSGFAPLGFHGTYGGANKVAIRMVSLYDEESIMMNAKNMGSSATGYVTASIGAIFVKEEYLIDLDGDE